MLRLLAFVVRREGGRVAQTSERKFKVGHYRQDEFLGLSGILRYTCIEKGMVMPQQPARSSRIEARIAPDALEIVKRAAEIQGRSVSEFVVSGKGGGESGHRGSERHSTDARRTTRLCRGDPESAEAFRRTRTGVREPRVVDP